MVAGWMLPAGGETIAAPGSLELCAKPKAVKNAQPTTSLSRDRRIQVFTVAWMPMRAER